MIYIYESFKYLYGKVTFALFGRNLKLCEVEEAQKGFQQLVVKIAVHTDIVVFVRSDMPHLVVETDQNEVEFILQNLFYSGVEHRLNDVPTNVLVARKLASLLHQFYFEHRTCRQVDSIVIIDAVF